MARTNTVERAAINDGKPKGSVTTRKAVTENEIARRAYERYLSRGCEHGHDVQDWLEAERELRRSS